MKISGIIYFDKLKFLDNKVVLWRNLEYSNDFSNYTLFKSIDVREILYAVNMYWLIDRFLKLKEKRVRKKCSMYWNIKSGSKKLLIDLVSPYKMCTIYFRIVLWGLVDVKPQDINYSFRTLGILKKRCSHDD